MGHVFMFKTKALQQSNIGMDANITNWMRSFPEFYNVFQNWLVISDEYPVENTHSIIRAQTEH